MYLLGPYLLNVSFLSTACMAFSPPASFFVKLSQLPLYTLCMRTNATYLYRSAPGIMFDCLCINLLLHNKNKCDLVANSVSCVSCNISTFIKPLQLVASSIFHAHGSAWLWLQMIYMLAVILLVAMVHQ